MRGWRHARAHRGDGWWRLSRRRSRLAARRPAARARGRGRSRTSCFCRRRRAIPIAPSRPSRAPGARGTAPRTSPTPSAFPTGRRSASPPPTSSSSRAATPRTCSRSGASTASTGPSATVGSAARVLGGVSAGANCWFEACVTDSFSVELDGLADGLGFLAGSFCPHFDGEERRRPVYTRLVAEGFPAGIACDDGAAAVYRGTELVEVVADRPGARGYRVSTSGVRAARRPARCDEEGLRHRLGERQRQDDRRPRARPAARRPVRRARRARARPELDGDAGRRAAPPARAGARGRRLGDRRRLPAQDRRPRARAGRRRRVDRPSAPRRGCPACSGARFVACAATRRSGTATARRSAVRSGAGTR